MKARQYLVIGAGRFGHALATTLHDKGHEVVVVDSSEEAIAQVAEQVTHAMIADATDEQVLAGLGCDTFDTVVVAIGGDLEVSALATVGVKEHGGKRVISKADSDLAAKVLLKVGADEVIRPEHDTGVRLAEALSTPDVTDAFDLGEDYSVVEIETHEKLAGSLAELRLSNRFGVQVVAVHREGQVAIAPGAEFALRPGDRIVAVGSNDAVERLKRFITD